MKRRESKFISKFTNDKLMIDKDFKMDLRNQILRRAKHVQKQPKTSRWLKLAPALMVVAGVMIAALVITSGAPANKSTNPLAPKKVSAKELLEKSENYYKSIDPTTAEFYTSVSMFKQGPMYEECQAGGMGSGSSRDRTINMAFNSSSTNVEASYNRLELETGALFSETSRYDDTAIEMEVNIPRDVSLPEFLEDYKINDELAYRVINQDGQVIAADDIQETEVNGRRVYEFYLQPDLQIIGSFSECKNEILQIVLDAQSYATIEFNIYTTSISPESLIVGNTQEVTYSSPGDEAALKIMTEAGFNKEKARNATDIYQ